MTESISSEVAVLKTDRRGHVRTPPEERNALLDAFEQSGLSGAAFARLHGIKYQTFAYWRQQRAKQTAPVDAEPQPFFEEVDIPPSVAAGLRIELPGGASLQLERADQFPMAAALLRYLEQA